MDDLTTLLRTASDGAPPTSIDVDGLIAGESRRRRTLIAVALSVFLVTGLSVTLIGRPGSRPAVVPPPAVSAPSSAPAYLCPHTYLPDSVPSRDPRHPVQGPVPEAPEVAARRLTAALPALLPDGARSKKCDRVEFYWEPKNQVYGATAWVGDDYSLSFMIEPTDSGTVPHCLNADGPDCTRLVQPDGAVAMADLAGPASKPQRSVTVFRPDGTTVLLAAIGRPAVLPAAKLLAAIGAAPGLTLYP